MRPILSFIAFSLYASVCVGQTTDTSRVNTSGTSEKSPQSQVLIPGVDSPVSSPGTLMQSSPNPNTIDTPQPRRRNRRNKTTPPSDPRAFGVSVPLGKAKRDSL